MGDETILQPHMLIVCHEIKKKFLDLPPALMVEILSPATALKDRLTKYDIYHQQRIPYYIIASPEDETIEVYEIENEEYVLHKKAYAFSYILKREACEAIIDFNETW